MSLATRYIVVGFGAEKHKRIEVIAARLDRSINWLVNVEIDHYLDFYEWQAEHKNGLVSCS